MRHGWLMVAVAALAAIGPAASARADEDYRDVFYWVFRVHDYEKSDARKRDAQIADMAQKLQDMKHRLGLDKRAMKFVRVGFQLTDFYKDALVQTNSNSNRGTSSYVRTWNTGSRPEFEAAYKKDPRYASWFRDNTPEGGGHVGHHGEIYLTPSRYAVELRKLWADELQKAAKTVTNTTSASLPFIDISGPGEGGLNDQVEMKPGQPVNNWADYSPFAVAEFRDWLTHRGLYSASGIYRGQGKAGGQMFAQDPSPDKVVGSHKSFNETYGTTFTTWKLRYWDLDQFKTMAPQAKPMPVAGEPGFVEGGFDAPRDLKEGDPFWTAFNNDDPAVPGFRQSMIQHYVSDTHDLLAKAGVPRDRIFSHQIFFATDPSPGMEDWTTKLRVFGSAAPIWTARTNSGRVGFTIYNNASHDDKSFQQMWSLLTPEERQYHKFALPEYHPYARDVDAAGKTKEDFARALALIAKWRPHIVVVESWDFFVYGGNKGYRTKDTPFEEALRDMFAAWPDKPFWQVPDPSTLPPPAEVASPVGTAKPAAPAKPAVPAKPAAPDKPAGP